MLYYKIPSEFVERLGLATTMVPFPDGRFFVPRAVMARINPDIDKALEITGGIALTLDEARDEQLGIAYHPLPGDPVDEADASMPQEGAAE